MIDCIEARVEHLEAWSLMRLSLWPDLPLADHRAEALAYLIRRTGQEKAIMALSDSGVVAGFAEFGLRFDYVNGCETSPVAFLEAIYVLPAFRRDGIGACLVATFEQWARSAGCSEIASDMDLGNVAALRFHEAAGFEVTERVVYLKKAL